MSRAFDMEEGFDGQDDEFDVNGDGDGGGNDGDDADTDSRPLKGGKGKRGQGGGRSKSIRTEDMEARYATIAPRTAVGITRTNYMETVLIEYIYFIRINRFVNFQ